ncbi:MAG: MaoC family dehydratase [Alphaproteobacteria bacterium]
MAERWFEDFTVGERFTTAGCTLSEAQILAFALAWDPQPFHLDQTVAAAGPYGGLIASGFQTLLVSFRLWHAAGVINAASIGSPGMDELRWTAPVRPGDTLHVEAEVLATKASRSKPDRGTAVIAYAVVNGRGDTVMTYRVTHLLRRRAEPGTPG